MKNTLCTIHVTCGFMLNGEGARDTDEFVFQVVYKTNQHMYESIKAEVFRRNPHIRFVSFLEYSLLIKESVHPIPNPFQIEG